MEDLRPVWRDSAQLARILARFAQIEAEAPERTRWHTGAAEWTMRLDDRTDEVAWMGESGAPLRRLAVRFGDLVGQQGTVVTLELDPPGGPLGRAAARAFGRRPVWDRDQRAPRVQGACRDGRDPDDRSAAGRAPRALKGDPMRALVWNGINDLRVETVDDPRIVNPKDVILRVTLSTTCGSDLHLIDGYTPTLSRAT